MKSKHLLKDFGHPEFISGSHFVHHSRMTIAVIPFLNKTLLVREGFC